jgi:hypothetical protein
MRLKSVELGSLERFGFAERGFNLSMSEGF